MWNLSGTFKPIISTKNFPQQPCISPLLSETRKEGLAGRIKASVTWILHEYNTIPVDIVI